MTHDLSPVKLDLVSGSASFTSCLVNISALIDTINILVPLIPIVTFFFKLKFRANLIEIN